MNIEIRPLTVQDVPQYLAVTKQIDKETDLLGVSPNDPRPNILQMVASLRANRQIIFVAIVDKQIVGHLGMFWRRGQLERVKHSMNVGLGVLKSCWGNGIGNALFEAAEQWAKENNIKRLELEVMTHNDRGIALYKKRGFKIEGTKIASILINNTFINEHLMAKVF
jgi:GNAT superfamily N-acetyltransferase